MKIVMYVSEFAKKCPTRFRLDLGASHWPLCWWFALRLAVKSRGEGKALSFRCLITLLLTELLGILLSC